MPGGMPRSPKPGGPNGPNLGKRLGAIGLPAELDATGSFAEVLVGGADVDGADVDGADVDGADRVGVACPPCELFATEESSGLGELVGEL